MPRFLNITRSLIVCVSLFSVVNANANLDTALHTMFGDLVNYTPAGAFGNQNRGVFSGPSLYYRTAPIQKMQLLNVTAPSFKNSCGSIDFHMGAFSMMKTQDIVNQLRGVAQSAIPYAFTIALGAMCGECLKDMELWAQKINDMAKMNIDGCKMVEDHRGDIESAVHSAMNQFSSETLVKDGDDSDEAASAFNSTATPADQANAAGHATEISGNILWKAISAQNLPSWFAQWTGQSNDTLFKREIMSLIGTIVVAPGDNGGDATKQTMQASIIPGVLRFSDFMYGNTSASVFDCTDNYSACLAVETNPSTKTNISGLMFYIRQRLGGDYYLDPNGLIAKLRARASLGQTGPTVADNQFLDSLPASARAQIIRSIDHPEIAQGQIDNLAAYSAVCITYDMLRSVVAAAQASLTKLDDQDKISAGKMRDQLVVFNNQLGLDMQAATATINSLNSLMAANDAIRASISGDRIKNFNTASLVVPTPAH